MNFWDSFKGKFHESWHDLIKPVIESEVTYNIYKYLKNRSKEGAKIAPLSSDTFKAFSYPLDEIKVVILGYCPYHTFINDKPIADGIAFSCSYTKKQQPSLRKMLEGIAVDLYGSTEGKDIYQTDLSYLSKQGVFLLNSSLTVEKDKPGSHQKLWEPFTKYVIENCLSNKNLTFLLLGKEAQYFEKFMTPITHGYIFSLSHPSFSARKGIIWDTKGVFSKIKHYGIQWLLDL